MDGKYPMEISLRGGGTVTLRPLEAGDEEALIAFFQSLPRESTQFLKDDVKDPAVIRRFISNADPNRVWAIVALQGDQIVGDATLHMSQRGWRRHVGEIRVVVSRELQKRRLATTLIHALVNQASERRLSKLEAQILDNQHGARKAFERLGFREEARLENHAMDLDGELHDLAILTHRVEDLWNQMADMISDMELARDGY